MSTGGTTSIALCVQYVCHAEMNAILNKNSADVKGCLVRRDKTERQADRVERERESLAFV